MSKLVMIIDDSVTVRKIVEVSLRREGIEYVSYSNGIEAVRALTEKKHVAPDLVFLDISLPRMDGYQFAQYLRSRRIFFLLFMNTSAKLHLNIRNTCRRPIMKSTIDGR